MDGTLDSDESVYYQEVESVPSPNEKLEEIHTTSMVIICIRIIIRYFTCSTYFLIPELVRYGL